MAADEPSQKRASGTDDNPAPAPCPQTSDLGPLTSDFPLSPDEDLTVLFDRLAFAQARRGWRFGIDAVLLARHVAAGPCGDTLEVGTGCGVVAILLADGGFAGPIVTVESQPALADRARRNVAWNGLGDVIQVIEGDIRDHARLLGDRTFTRVVANPPFHAIGTGRTNPEFEKAVARHEMRLDVDGLLDVVRAHLSPDGLASVLYPAGREADVVRAAAGRALSVTCRTPCVPAPGRPPRVVLLDLAHGAGRATAEGSPVLMDRRSAGFPR